MSTFDGVVAEFLDIRIDYFRLGPDAKDVKACFLSHVHSDHLAGLESLRSHFVYCSAATKELLLRLERYSDRINFAKGILESRRITYDRKRFRGLLRSVPLNVPTEIELSPVRKIRVTLLPANHCPGSVMFLIESESSAVLYTGDIRAEPWWVNMIARHPAMIPYATGIRILDKIYLDTTNASSRAVHRGYVTKAEGIRELIQKVSKYPSDTIFHINSWTLGYEDVFVALSTTLRCQVHVDAYKMRLYRSLAQSTEHIPSEESLTLCGFNFGNGRHEGCLTEDPNTRLHTCELGTDCPALDSGKTVYIAPVVTRGNDGVDVPELGAMAGTGDLDLAHEIELSNPAIVNRLLQLCVEHLNDAAASRGITQAITKAARLGKKTISIPSAGLPEDLSDLSIKQIVELVLKAVETPDSPEIFASGLERNGRFTDCRRENLGRRVTFPFSRHSSYEELCHLVSVFRPKDVFPCVVDAATWHTGTSIKALFGRYCSSTYFSHDAYMNQSIKSQHLYPSLQSSMADNSTPGNAFQDSAELSANQSFSDNDSEISVLRDHLMMIEDINDSLAHLESVAPSVRTFIEEQRTEMKQLLGRNAVETNGTWIAERRGMGSRARLLRLNELYITALLDTDLSGDPNLAALCRRPFPSNATSEDILLASPLVLLPGFQRLLSLSDNDNARSTTSLHESVAESGSPPLHHSPKRDSSTRNSPTTAMAVELAVPTSPTPAQAPSSSPAVATTGPEEPPSLPASRSSSPISMDEGMLMSDDSDTAAGPDAKGGRKRSAEAELRLARRKRAYRAAKDETGKAWKDVANFSYKGYPAEEEL